MRRGIICAGCWTLDRTKIVDTWPNEESLARILSQDRQGGGSGHNVSMNLKSLDSNIPVFGMGLLGEDEDGDFLFQQAGEKGIDTAGLQRTSVSSTSYTDVYTVQSTAKRTFFHSPGANDALTPDHFGFSDHTAKLLHLGLLGVHATLDNAWENEPNGWVATLKSAKLAGLQTNIEMVSIDPERNRTLCLPCLPYLDTLIVNDQEIGSLANINTLPNGIADPDRCASAAKQVFELGAMHTVIVHFPAGSICIQKNHEERYTRAVTVPPAEIVSTVGAGDAFAAGVLYGLHENWPMEKVLQLAHAAAAASLRSPTTVGSVESVAKCLKYAASCNNER